MQGISINSASSLSLQYHVFFYYNSQSVKGEICVGLNWYILTFRNKCAQKQILLNIFILQFYFLCKLFPVLTHLIFHFWQAVENIVVFHQNKIKTLKTTTMTETILLIDSKQRAEVGRKCKVNRVFLSPAFFLINVNLFNIKYCQ